MTITFKSILIGAEDEEKWLCNLKHAKIKIERNLYSNTELKEKYNYFKLDSRWPFWFDTEDQKVICYELSYVENIEEYNEKKLEEAKNRIFNECERLIYFINCYFGTSIVVNFGKFYYNDKLDDDFSKSLLSSYNPSILEDYSKISISKENLEYFLNNIEEIINRSNKIDTVLETYNINMTIPNVKIAFLNLVTCLESLLVNTNFELTYQISRGISVLLSKNKEEGNYLFNKMKKLYEIRCKLIHNGIWDVDKYYKNYDNEPFEDLKELFILSFRKFIKLNLDKSDFIKLINESGYGELNT